MRQDIIELFDEYTHERLDRRVFMDQLAKLAGGTTAAAALVPILKANYASAAIVPADDARLTVEEVSFPAPAATCRATWRGPRMPRARCRAWW